MSAAGLCAVEPALLDAWVHGRAISRGTAMPVRDGDGYAIETGLPHEIRRYVFPGASVRLAELGAAITTPRILLKACVPAAVMRALLPPWWEVSTSTCMMVDGGTAPMAVTTLGYALEVATEGAIVVARAVAPDGNVAASGRAVRHGGYLVYDQIVTDPAHRRRGLASAVIAQLHASAGSGERHVLVATEAGRALYAALGWRVVAPYSTAVLPD